MSALSLAPALLVPLTLAASGCAGDAAGKTPPDQPNVVRNEAGEPRGIERHRRWTARVGQGAQPQGEIAFRNLRALGYRVVLSVDGAVPEVDLAARYGLRYVHIPMGYDGVPRETALRIMKAVQTAEGPVFVHCHHGKHRGPAAAMAALRGLDGLSAERAVALMKESKTSPKYSGLYRDVQNLVPPSAEELASVSADLPSKVLPDGLLASMVDVDRRFAFLRDSRDRRWGTLPENPDVSPPHEARMLWELFRESARMEESKKYGAEFMTLLKESEDDAKRLEDALRAGQKKNASRAFGRILKNCTACHASFRD